ncbi:polysaccharide deacetylase family protein [Pseudoduganella sp. FT25W]|uniref:Polysaccharide deacetylase family protein n=1 Tax=Duganella alba TaxID=2666081 RepID=A0A6L5Q9R8_9BURK|nr:polysaccharide deacetylase family protein [Duganella alba]MRX06437.1 polysaccharide deacetylase family protein [Duganella alba]MRX14831.1 polysaccharide deacetylase family protein [Duganella alba]
MTSQRLSILIYHRVLARRDPLLPSLPDIRRFDGQMAMLKRAFNVLPLGLAVRLLQRQALPPRAACITFDDGYADNAEYALPILQRHGLKATFFIASGYLNGGQMWNDDVIEHARQVGLRPHELDQLLQRLKYLPFDERERAASALAPPRSHALMMRADQVQALHAAGMDIGAHTHRHPILANLPDAEALADIRLGKAALENITQAPVTLFAYPNGKPGVDYNQRHVQMVLELGFEAACSTVAGVAYDGSDMLQLPRFTPWEPDRLRFFLRLLAQRRIAV